MSLRAPNLDDRRFQDLVEEARRLIVQRCPQWTDLGPSDPGMVLIEVFAHLTEVLIYRLNRVPDKAYIEFLRLIGTKMQPPMSAEVDLVFSLARAQDRPVEIPRGTRVTVARSGSGAEPPVFVTADTVSIPAGAMEVTVRAYHGEFIAGERLGIGTGRPGLTLNASRPPIVAPTGSNLDLILGVEAEPEELGVGIPAIEWEGKAYRLWNEVWNFSNLGADRHVYVADRLTGTVSFAPAARTMTPEGQLEDLPNALAEIPRAGREIRLWYLRGGGVEGNVAANTLTTLKDQIPGIKVTNPQPALGGRAAETLENALVRGAQELHSLRRTVTARDYEIAAVRASGAVSRAKAFTTAEVWAHARPGTVNVLLVPNVSADGSNGGQVTAEVLKRHESEVVRERIQKALADRKPLGTECSVQWARCKTVKVEARIVVYREEDPARIRAASLSGLHQLVNPLTWPFGRPLRVSDVYKAMSQHPGIRSIDRVRLVVDEVPDKEVRSLGVDAFQAHTWYAGAGDATYRSLNNGDSWELIGQFPGEQVELVRPYTREAGGQRPGALAVATRGAGDKPVSKLYISRDCGESWETELQTNFEIEDMAWAERDGALLLFLATERGLYELAVPVPPGAGPEPVLVDPSDQSLGFYAVAVSHDIREGTSVAVAAQKNRGVFLSAHGGLSNSFKPVGLDNKLVRVLAVQHLGPHRYLWAGTAAPGTESGEACFRWRLTGSTESVEGWKAYSSGWQVGSCHGLAFHGSTVFAATFRGGILSLDADAHEPTWHSPSVKCGLPMRDPGRFQPVLAVATTSGSNWLFGAGVEGVFRSRDGGKVYQPCSQKEQDPATLPKMWLWCSGDHEIEVVSEDEADRD
jgi:hypothetical protein